jgi:hypothetical protein
MTSLLTWLRSGKTGQAVLFTLGLLLTGAGYWLWQVIAALVYFLAIGSGEGHRNEGLLVEGGFLVLQVGLLSWLFWRRVLYPTWWAWALNVTVAISLFTNYAFLPWYGAPPDSTYQRYTFVQGDHHYEITLENPDHVFDLSDVTNQKNGSTTSLLLGDYQVRHDTIFFREWAGSRKGFLYDRTLVGFENSTRPIPLTRERDSTPWTLW